MSSSAWGSHCTAFPCPHPNVPILCQVCSLGYGRSVVGEEGTHWEQLPQPSLPGSHVRAAYLWSPGWRGFFNIYLACTSQHPWDSLLSSIPRPSLATLAPCPCTPSPFRSHLRPNVKVRHCFSFLPPPGIQSHRHTNPGSIFPKNSSMSFISLKFHSHPVS